MSNNNKEIEDVDAALESAGRELANDTAGYARSLIEKVDRPVTKIKANAFGLTVAWRDGIEVFVSPSGTYQVVGTELWMDEDEVAKRVVERLRNEKPAYESLCRQISDACAQISQGMRKKGVALLRELNKSQRVDSVSVDKQGLVLTLYGDTRRRVDAKVGVLGEVSVALDGVAVPAMGSGVTYSVKLVQHLLENKPLSSITNDSTLAATSQELGSLMKTVVSELGLLPEHGASAKPNELGWMLSFYCQTGRVEMLVCHDRSVLVKRNGKPALQAPDVSMAVIYLKELLAEEKKEKVLTRPHPPADPLTNLTREIQSHLNNDASHLISKLGLSPSDYSADICASGLTIVIHGRIKATVRCNGTVQVERYDQLVCQSQNVEMVLPFVKELIADDSPCKRKIQVEEEEEEEDEPPIKQKSPKLAIIEEAEAEEEPVAPTQLVNLE